MDSLEKYAYTGQFSVKILEPTFKRRKTREKYGSRDKQRMFNFWCGSDHEGLCPLCQSRRLVRVEQETWEVAHICSWGRNGTNSLYNVFPCCHACNRRAENGGLRYGMRSVNHLDGIVLNGYKDSVKYGHQLATFMDRCYNWLFASGERVRELVDSEEDRLPVLVRYYGPSAPGGWTCPEVGDTYTQWLKINRKMDKLSRARDRAARDLEKAKNALIDAEEELEKFEASNVHYLRPD